MEEVKLFYEGGDFSICFYDWSILVCGLDVWSVGKVLG